MVQGTSTVDRCNVVGGQDGIVTHGSMAMFMHNHVTNTTQYGIAMTEMSMGSLEHNTVSNAKGVGMYCGDRSMCEITRNVVRGTRADSAGGDKTRAGFGLEVLYGAEADLSGNDFKSNPLSLGVFLNSRVRWIR
jgi:parallel beta-helix repeat protein